MVSGERPRSSEQSHPATPFHEVPALVRDLLRLRGGPFVRVLVAPHVQAVGYDGGPDGQNGAPRVLCPGGYGVAAVRPPCGPPSRILGFQSYCEADRGDVFQLSSPAVGVFFVFTLSLGVWPLRIAPGAWPQPSPSRRGGGTGVRPGSVRAS